MTSASTTLAVGTDNQAFCYDEQNRLVWAGTTGTPSGPADGAGTCGATPAPATLDGGSYSASYAYDTLNRLTSGPGGSYTYGDPNHLDAVTETGGGYTASYDAAGNMSCRAPSSSATCTGGTPTGAKLTFDSEGRLAGWQSAYTLVNGTQTASYLYDGSGTRIEQSTSTRGFSGSTAILYLGNGLADYTFNNGAPTPTHVNHYTFAGRMVAVRDNTTGGTLHYLLADQINSPELQLSASGAAEAVVLRTPYGASRYGASALYSYGFTGQRQDDTTSGLDYDHARYYDPAVGQFVSADSDPKGGLNRFAYVAGNPETATDPTGHRSDCRRFNECSGGGKGGCTSNCTPQQPTGPQNPQKPQNPKGCRATGTCDSDGNYCDKACQIEKAEEAAKNDALGSANLLQVVGQWLTWFTWLVGAATIFVTAGAALAAVFQPETLPMWAMWSARLLIFTIQLAQLIGTVNYYHDMFAGEADHDLSWFTGPHVEDYLSSRNSVFAFMGITADGTNLLALAATITKWGAKALGVTLPGYVGVAINAVALVGLYAYTEAQINQQEADLCPTALAQAHGC